MNPPAKASSDTPVGQINMVGKGAIIEGTFQVSGDVRVGGKIIGEVSVAGKMITTPDGIVDGEIKASSGDIAGRVRGDLHIKERLVLRSTAVIEGNIVTSKLVIEDGATFSGKCDMNNSGRSASAPKPSGTLGRSTDKDKGRPAQAPAAKAG